MRIWNPLAPAVVLALGTLLAIPPNVPAQEPPPPPEGIEIIARGPVHEAYAEPATPNPEPQPVIRKEPPEPIEELPPDVRPEGEDVVWIPGYWAWDDDSNDYLWISGFWREAPPLRTWVPGYWSRVQGGWQWSSGFWAASQTNEITYVPPPPESLETGPAIPAPEPTMVYVPGVWVWRDARFYWRPGFWTDFRPGWVWVPAHYCWTPSGYVFIEGYWDYPLHDRGLLFAPIRVVNVQVIRTVRYIPTYVVQPDFLISALFVQPRTRTYYFGDYFEPRYRQRGLVSWVDYSLGRQAYDYNFSYYQRRFRSDEWTNNLRQLYAARFRGDIARPPRTWQQQQNVINNIVQNRIENRVVNQNINITHVQNVSVLAPLNRLENNRITALASLAGRRGDEQINIENERNVIQLTRVNQAERQERIKQAQQIREVRQQRAKAEARLIAERPTPRPGAPRDPGDERGRGQSRAIKLDLPAMVTDPRPGRAEPGDPRRPVEPRPGRPPARRTPPPTAPRAPAPNERVTPPDVTRPGARDRDDPRPGRPVPGDPRDPRTPPRDPRVPGAGDPRTPPRDPRTPLPGNPRDRNDNQRPTPPDRVNPPTQPPVRPTPPDRDRPTPPDRVDPRTQPPVRPTPPDRDRPARPTPPDRVDPRAQPPVRPTPPDRDRPTRPMPPDRVDPRTPQPGRPMPPDRDDPRVRQPNRGEPRTQPPVRPTPPNRDDPRTRPPIRPMPPERERPRVNPPPTRPTTPPMPRDQRDKDDKNNRDKGKKDDK